MSGSQESKAKRVSVFTESRQERWPGFPTNIVHVLYRRNHYSVVAIVLLHALQAVEAAQAEEEEDDWEVVDLEELSSSDRESLQETSKA